MRRNSHWTTERKTGSRDYVKPLKNWKLPDSSIVLGRRQQPEREKHGTRDFIEAPRLVEQATAGDRDLARVV